MCALFMLCIRRKAEIIDKREINFFVALSINSVDKLLVREIQEKVICLQDMRFDRN